MNRRAALTSLVGAALVAATVGACGCNDASQADPDVEDCDAEDYANRGTDCGFAPKSKTTKKPTKKSTKKSKRKTKR